MLKTTFEWDESKNLGKQEKHGVSFETAQHAFLDDNRVIAEDPDLRCLILAERQAAL